MGGGAVFFRFGGFIFKLDVPPMSPTMGNPDIYNIYIYIIYINNIYNIYNMCIIPVKEFI